MKIHRIRLRNYRGVSEHEVEFGDGITIVEGANEAGKSSLVEALDLLLEFYDDSAHKRVAGVRPTHADVAPEVEAELSAGPYRFVYLKRWSKRSDAATQLTVLTPRAESVTGREAHERVNTILGETTDLGLWRALRIQQNDPLDLPNLRERATLAHALDAAAGRGGSSSSGGDSGSGNGAGSSDSQSGTVTTAGSGSGSGPASVARTSNPGAAPDLDDAALITRAKEEYERYFTPKKGEPTGEYAKAAADLAAAEEVRARCQEVLDRIAQNVDEHARVERELVTLAKNARDHEPVLRELQRRWTELEERGRQVSQLAGQAETARIAADGAADAVAVRETLRAEAEAARTDAADLDLRATESAAAQGEAAQRAKVADAAAEAAHAAAVEAQAAATRATADREHLRDLRDGAALAARCERAQARRDEVAAAERALATLRVDQGALDRIEREHGSLVKAQAAFEAATAVLEVEAVGEAEVKLDVDGTLHALQPGATLAHRLAGGASLTINELVRVGVRPGNGERDLKAKHDKALAAFSALCDESGVTGLDDARRAVAARRDAEASLTSLRTALAAELGGSALDELRDELNQVNARIEAYRSARGDSPLPESAEAANEAAAVAAARLKELQETDAERAAAAKRYGTAEREAALSQALRQNQAENARSQAASLATRLAEARDKESDEALGERRARAAQHAEEATAQWDLAAREHGAADPDSVEAELKNAVALGERIARETQENREQRRELAGRLLADQDAQERFNAAADRCLTAERMHDSLRRRAEAARLLYRTLGANRDAAKLAYIEPFRAKVERLARIVFGERLSLDVDENLAITSRTLDGVTVPYEQLSGGAREQLALCARLAVAALVDPADGVPVVIDDALGFTDPERLRKVGAMFTAVDSRAQVIVLTCTPERYRGIGTATVRRISRGGNGGSSAGGVSSGGTGSGGSGSVQSAGV